MKRTVTIAVITLAACNYAPFLSDHDAGPRDAGVGTFPDAGPPADGGLSTTEACRALNTARCAYLARCGLIDPAAMSHEACVAAFEASWCGPATWPPHVAAGALRYDGVKAVSCAEAFATQACAEWETLPDSCTSFLKPRAQLGQPCYDGYTECTDGVCRGSTCPRTCQPRALLDELCTRDADCRTGLFCRFASLIATSGTCTAYSGVGGSCDGANRCLDGLRCVALQCQPLPTAGLPCLDGLCSEQAFCDVRAADGGLCSVRKQNGALCAGDECEAELFCEPITSRCQPLLLSSGDTCTLQQQCPDGQVCVGATPTMPGVCGAPLQAGEACVSSHDCEAHLACLGGDGGLSCQRRLAPDGGCKAASDCQASATCLGGRCAELPLPGESCAETRACRWGLCREVASSDGGAVCGALLSAGQPCQWGGQCASGTCERGACVARCVP
ncbi:MAG: Dickkopf N-terminal cysteine-rich domain-containing protein [Myxococcota bacterium]